jgi:GNAT superfamily N-acetyltransferase
MRKLLAALLPNDFADTPEFSQFWRDRCDELWAINKEDYFSHLIYGLKSAVHVGEVDGVIRGFGLAIGDEIAGNFVEEGWRRRRLASAIMMQSLGSMRERGETKAWLGVWKKAKGPQRFYASCLFTKNSDEIITHPPGHNGHPPADSQFAVNDVRMELPSIAEAHEKLRDKFALGSVASSATIEVELGPLHMLHAVVRRGMGMYKRFVDVCSHINGHQTFLTSQN